MSNLEASDSKTLDDDFKDPRTSSLLNAGHELLKLVSAPNTPQNAIDIGALLADLALGG